MARRKKGESAISTLPKNILVVDFDTGRNVHEALLLKRLEYNVFVATSGQDMMRVAGSVVPNAVLMDLRMPLLDGHTCLERLRSNSRFAMIKVVMMSEATDEKYLKDCLNIGANAYVTRPLSPTVLYKTFQGLTETRPRSMPRLRVIFKATVHSGTTARSSYATMISEKGLFVRTMNPFPKGDRVRVALELPSARPLILDGEVIYNVKYERDEFVEPGMGIIFTGLKDEIREGLRKFIEAHLTGDLEPDLAI